MRKKHENELILILASLIWGVGYISVAMALKAGAGATSLSFMRFVVASVCMLPLVYKQLRVITRSALIKGAILGLLNMGGYYAQTIGQLYTTTTNVGFLTSVDIVIIPFMTVLLLGRKMRLRSLIAAIITLVGIGFLTLHGGFRLNSGDAYVLLCALIFAVYTTITDAFAKTEDAKILVFVQFVVSALLFGAILPFSGENLVVSGEIIGHVLYLAIGSNIIATTLYTYGLGRTSAERGSVIVACTAVYAAILGIILFGEPFNANILIGTSLIFVSILYSENVIFKTKGSL